MKSIFRYGITLVLILFFSIQVNSQEIVTPSAFFGFKPGTNTMLFDYEKLIEYMEVLDKTSPRVKLVNIGESPMGRPMYLTCISSSENIQNLEKLKAYNQKLALSEKISKSEMEEIQEYGKVFVYATLSMHSTEVAPAQASPTIVYELATTNDPEKLKWLDDVVYLIVPNHNPDGMDLIVNNYNKYKGSKYEGSSLPGVYHKYVGHDNNRDFVILSQSDSKAVSNVTSKEWFPQVMVEKHQMGSVGPRYFVPPNHDPIAENIDAGLFTWNGIFGANMVNDMTTAGLKGISQHYAFDNYWPGSTETCIWKNVISFLTEAASCQIATPVFVEKNELNVRGKGISEYKKGANFLDPWPGGWWGLEELVTYELESTYSILKTASKHKKEILKFRHELTAKEINKGRTQAPYYYIFPQEQKDRTELINLVNLLLEHGVRVFDLKKDIVLNNKMYYSGDIVVPLAQPFRSFVKEVLETQKFPERHYTPGGKLIQPYDITTWSLPLHRSLDMEEINVLYADVDENLNPITSDITIEMENAVIANMILPVRDNGSFEFVFKALAKGIKIEQVTSGAEVDGSEIEIGSFLVKDAQSKNVKELVKSLNILPLYVQDISKLQTKQITMPRIALVEHWMSDMDAGWTRYVFDTYGVNYKVLRPYEIPETDLEKDFDVLVFPDANKSLLLKGKYESEGQYYANNYPPEYSRGMEKKGLEKVMLFMNNGGKIISWGQSVSLFEGPQSIKTGKNTKEEFQLPFSDLSKSMQKNGLYCPGSLVKINLIPGHPLTYGMKESVGVFYRGRPVLKTSIPYFDMDRRVIAFFPEENILMSGYIEKEELLENQAAMVWLKKGEGQMVLYSFGPQFRASTQGSFKLLFNAIFI